MTSLTRGRALALLCIASMADKNQFDGSDLYPLNHPTDQQVADMECAIRWLRETIYKNYPGIGDSTFDKAWYAEENL
jgi:hypothetical protein